MLTKRILQNKPYYFLATEKEAWTTQREIIRVQLARFFNCSPAEFDSVPERRLRRWMAIIEGLTEFEKERGDNGR